MRAALLWPLLLWPLLLGSLACGEGRDERDSAARLPGEGRMPETVEQAPALPGAPSGAPTVAFVGDSICAGLHVAESQAFPAVLARRLAAEGLPFRAVNACESGRTTAGARTALDWVLRSAPDVVVLEIGGNDGLRGIELDLVEANLRALIEGARAAGARVLLCGVRLPPNYGAYATAFDALYPRLAEETGVAFVPFFMEGVGGVAEQNLEDGLHPTPQGHERLATNVAPALRALLRELAARAPADAER